MPGVKWGRKKIALQTKMTHNSFSNFCKSIRLLFRYFIIIRCGIYGLFVIINSYFVRNSSNAFIFCFGSFMKQSLRFINTFKCRTLALRKFAPHNPELGPTDGTNSYSVDYQFMWICETYSVVCVWDGKVVCAEPIQDYSVFLYEISEKNHTKSASPAFGFCQKNYVLYRHSECSYCCLALCAVTRSAAKRL
jgi:hypothetical protein